MSYDKKLEGLKELRELVRGLGRSEGKARDLCARHQNRCVLASCVFYCLFLLVYPYYVWWSRAWGAAKGSLHNAPEQVSQHYERIEFVVCRRERSGYVTGMVLGCSGGKGPLRKAPELVCVGFENSLRCLCFELVFTVVRGLGHSGGTTAQGTRAGNTGCPFYTLHMCSVSCSM